jgi:hypothetical protein
MKYYDVTYKKPIEHDSGHSALGKLRAVECEDSASIDEVKNQALHLISFSSPWTASEFEIISVVETPEENRPRPLPDDAIVD